MINFVYLLIAFTSLLKIKLSWTCNMDLTHQIESLHYLLFA